MAGQRETPTGVDWDTDAYMRALTKRVNALRDGTEADVKAAANKWVTRAKAYAPVRTGFMKSNIVMEEGRDRKGFFVEVYCRAAYWKWVEFGTRFMAPQPFMRPAFAEALRYMHERITKRAKG